MIVYWYTFNVIWLWINHNGYEKINDGLNYRVNDEINDRAYDGVYDESCHKYELLTVDEKYKILTWEWISRLILLMVLVLNNGMTIPT